MLEINQLFPSKLDQARIAKQIQWEKMLNGEYIYNVIIDNQGKKQNVDPLVPIPAALSEINSDLLFGEFPEVDFQSDPINQRVNEHMEKELFQTKMIELTTYKSSMGMMFWNNFKRGKNVFLEFIKPSNAVWTEDIWGLNNIQFFKALSETNTEITYTVQEHYYEYKIDPLTPDFDVENDRTYLIQEYEIIVAKSSRKITKLDKGATTKPEIKFIPVIKDLNLGQIGYKIGKSDYQGKEQLFAEIDNRIDQINYVLQENAEPWTFVPSGILNQYGHFNRKNGKMVEKTAVGNSTVEVVQWDAALSSAFQQIEKMIELVFFTGRISAPIAGLEKGGNVESGRALKWRSINTLSMIKRKRLYAEQALKQYFLILSKLDSEFTDLPMDDLQIVWKNTLPLDEKEHVDSIIAQVNAEILSKVKAIQEVNSVDEEQATEEYDRIKSETQEFTSIEQPPLTI